MSAQRHEVVVREIQFLSPPERPGDSERWRTPGRSAWAAVPATTSPFDWGRPVQDQRDAKRGDRVRLLSISDPHVELEEIARERGGSLKVGKVDVDAEPELTARAGALSILFVVLYREGEPVAHSIGAMPKQRLEEALGLVDGLDLAA